MTEVPESTLRYPSAERLTVVDELHGHRIPDPYRWLEDTDDPRTAQWQAGQAVLTRSVLDALPGRHTLSGTLEQLFQAGSVTTPVWRAGRSFFTRRRPGQEHAVLYLRERDGDERVLIDVTELDPSGLTTLDGWTPSIEGDRLTYLISTGGDEESQLFVLDVASARIIDGPIERAKFTSIAWLPGGEEFFYVRRLAAHLVPEGEDQFHRRVYRHRVGTDPDEADKLVHGEGLDITNYYGVKVSRDGRWLVVDASAGTARRDAVWIADLHGDGEPREVISDELGARCAAWVERDGRLYLLTSLDAPRWRLCVADPENPRPEHWTELIAEEDDSVLDAVRWLDGGDEPARLVVLRTRHAVAELHLHEPATGRYLDRIPLPGTGALTGLSTVDISTETGRDQVWIGWTDFVTPACVHRFSLATGQTELVEAAPGAVELPDVRTQQLTFTSADGTEVRMFVLSPAGEPDRPRPAFMTGYGGFAISREPGYTPTALAWVAAGGVWALVSLRGGGEEGEAWHLDGMRDRKQNVFDDFHAAAEHLIDKGWTSAEQLSISGGSNGGLLVGAALTQRPELYRAVLCSAPLLDMVRYEQFLIGRIWHEEYGSASNAEELGWLLSYSPYHRVREATAYPSVLFTVFESDARVDPVHARKMCAALQHATSSDPRMSPVLLRSETEVGHSVRSVSRTVGLAVDQIAFLANATGLDLETL